MAEGSRFLIEGHSLSLPPGHDLPNLQAHHAMYDRLLPELAKFLEGDANTAIIDVGANVGDTALALVSHCKHRILCVEGFDEYFSFLSDNIVRNGLQNRVECIRALTGTGRFSGDLKGDGTTATRVSGTGGISVPLDRILGSIWPSADVELLKIDTDGYDGDVIASSTEIIERCRPLVFWENYFGDCDQRGALEEGYAFLARAGYEHIWVFDNFGNPILEDCSLSVMPALNDYISRQDKPGVTRTIYYTDVLAATERNMGVAGKAVDSLKRRFA